MLTFEGPGLRHLRLPRDGRGHGGDCCQIVEHNMDQLLPHFQFDYAAGWEDICFKNGPIVSVKLFNEWWCLGISIPKPGSVRRDLWSLTAIKRRAPHLARAGTKGGINRVVPSEVNGCCLLSASC